MNIDQFLHHLRSNADKAVSLRLPDGSFVASHFHITEVGHVSKRFIDCGGTRRFQEICLLQTWVHDDIEHRLCAGKLASIFEHAADLLPSRSLDVEVEHEMEVLAQFTVESAEETGAAVIFNLGSKHTDCLARGVCLPDTCTPKPEPVSRCTPGGGCC